VIADRTSLLRDIATSTPQKPQLHTIHSDEPYFKICPHNSTSAGAQLWACTAVQSAIADRTSLIRKYAASTPQNSPLQTMDIDKPSVKICPHNSTSAGAQLWACTAVQSAIADCTSLIRKYAASTPQNSPLQTMDIYKSSVEICPHNSTSAGAQPWACTAVQSVIADRTSLLQNYARSTPQKPHLHTIHSIQPSVKSLPV
jgi:hypothetical protein